MFLDLRHIKSIKELKDEIIRNKEDEAFRISLVDNLVDGEIQQWLAMHPEVGSAMMVDKLKAIDYSQSDTEILQSVYDIFQISTNINTPDLSNNFELIGVRLDAGDIIKDEIIIKDDLQHNVSAVIKVTRPVNEKLELTLMLERQPQKESHDMNANNKKSNISPSDFSKIMSPEFLSKLQSLLNDRNDKSKFFMPTSPMVSSLLSGINHNYLDVINKLLEESKTKVGKEKSVTYSIVAATIFMLMSQKMEMPPMMGLPKGLFQNSPYLPQRHKGDLYLNVATNSILDVVFPPTIIRKGKLAINYNHHTLIEIPISN